MTTKKRFQRVINRSKENEEFLNGIGYSILFSFFTAFVSLAGLFSFYEKAPPELVGINYEEVEE